MSSFSKGITDIAFVRAIGEGGGGGTVREGAGVAHKRRLGQRGGRCCKGGVTGAAREEGEGAGSSDVRYEECCAREIWE